MTHVEHEEKAERHQADAPQQDVEQEEETQPPRLAHPVRQTVVPLPL